jgi:hypothetical protein
MTDEQHPLPDTGLTPAPRPSTPVSRSLSMMPLFMYATDREISRQVPPRGLGVCRGSALVGQKELALPGQRKSKRGNGAAPAALPQDRPMATTSLLSRGSDQGHDALELNSREVLPAG